MTELQTKVAPVALKALMNFSYNGMVLKGQYFTTQTLSDAKDLITRGLAQEVTSEQLEAAEADQVAKQLQPVTEPLRNAVHNPVNDTPEEFDDDWDDTEPELTFTEQLDAADTHAKLDAVVAEFELQSVPVKDKAKLADRKAAALAEYAGE